MWRKYHVEVRKNYMVRHLLFATVVAAILIVQCISISTVSTGDINITNKVCGVRKYSQTIELMFNFSPPQIKREGMYGNIIMPGLGNFGKTGEPVLPFKTVKILLPQDRDVLSINVTSGDGITLEGRFEIKPGQKPMPLRETQEINEEILSWKNQTVYDSSEPFPGKLYSNIGIQTFRGYNILILDIYPVEYIPSWGKIQYFENIDIKVKIKPVKESNNLFRGLQKDETIVKSMVDNPDMVDTYQEKTKNIQRSSSVNPLDNYDHVIITNNALNSSTGAYTFQDLAEYKNSKGISTTIVTVESILNESAYWDTNPLFNDTQAIIRNFIIDAYTNWGIEYVLLGGDGDGADVGGESGDCIIPHRGFYVNTGCYVDNDIPSDIYYACFDGNFNYDEDSYWAEPNDGPGGGEVDLYAEVYVGRAPVDSVTELQNFVMKTLVYENTAHSYLKNVWMVGEYLWGPPEYQNDTWGGDYKNEIKDGSNAHGYTTTGIPNDYNTTTLYDKDHTSNNWPKSSIIDAINSGVHIVNHVGHAHVGYVMKMENLDIDSLINNRVFFGYSQGCYAGAFDNRDDWHVYTIYDCIVERFVTTPHGAFAFVANSRYGWGEPGSTDGPSQHFDREFFDALFGENIREIGRANQDSKEDTIGWIVDPVIRWCYYNINLFGDPTVRIRDPIKPEHDISVSDLNVSRYSFPNETITVYTTIYNNGQNVEKNVTVHFIVNNNTVESTLISSITNGVFQNIVFNWTPTENGVYNISIYAEPVLEENITDNNILCTFVVVGPDICVSTLTAPRWTKTNENITITATIQNLGKVDETNIAVRLEVNDNSIENTTISMLKNGTNIILNFSWSGKDDGWHNISVWTLPVIGEEHVENNKQTCGILVTSKEIVKVVVIDSYGTDNAQEMCWDDINENWMKFGNTPIEINYTALNKNNITYQDIVDSTADVLFISSCAYSWEFTDDEIEAITRYTENGHGLIATSTALHYCAQNNNKLAPLFGMKEDIDYTVTGILSLGILEQNTTLFTNISDPYIMGHGISCTPTDTSWDSTDLTNGVYVAKSSDLKGAIIVNGHQVYIGNWPEHRSNNIDKQFLYNTIIYSSYEKFEHDISVINLHVAKYLAVGQTINVNATIRNFGLNDETNITVNFTVNRIVVNTTQISVLQSGASQNVCFTWSSPTEGNYTIAIEVAPLLGENITSNNQKNTTVVVRIPAPILIIDDDHDLDTEICYTDALITNAYSYDLWRVTTEGSPDLTVLQTYEAVIWFTGNDDGNKGYETLTVTDRTNLGVYLDNGGKLFLSGGLIGLDAYYMNGWSDWYQTYLHATLINFTKEAQILNGIPNDPIGDGVVLHTHVGDANLNLWGYSSQNTPISPGISSFVYQANDYGGVIRADSGIYKVVYFGFDFADIDNVFIRNTLMDRIMTWLLAVPINHQPLIDGFTPIVDLTINETESITFSVIASDPDNDDLICCWYLNGAILHGEINDSYIFTTNYDSSGVYEIKVVVTDDGFPALSVNHSWNLTVLNKNRKPVLEPTADQTAYEGKLFILQVNASDPDNDSIVFLDNSTLFDINSTTGLISFTPNYDSAGVYWINITVTDGADIDWQVFKLTINKVNRAPTAVISSPQDNGKFITKDNIYFDATGSSDPDNDNLIYTWTSSIDGNIGNTKSFSRKLSEGTHTITVTVSDGTIEDYKQITVTVEKTASQQGKGFLPGFEVVSLIATIGVCVILLRRRKH